MKFLKGLALSLLSLLLFLSLSIFGLAFMLNSTILNPNFIVSEMDRLDISAVVEEFTMEGPGERAPEEFQGAIFSTITKLEPVVKEQVSAAIYPIYDYSLGKSESLDLAYTLRNTALTSDFVASLIDELDLSSLAGEFLGEQLTEQVPEEMEFLVETLDLDDAIAELEPTIKAELVAAADPILDYLLGERQSLSVEISLEPVVESLENTLMEAFLESPEAFSGLLPEEFADLIQTQLADLTPAQLEQYFNTYIGQKLAEVLPSTFVINESMLGTEIPTQIAEALAGAEDALAEARQYVGYFQIVYYGLIGLMVLLIAGIILLKRNVRGATRGLGITFLIYGVLEFAGVFATRNFLPTSLPLPDIPASLQSWLMGLIGDFVAPLQTFSIGLLVGGVVLLIVSFVYKPRVVEEEYAENQGGDYKEE